MPTMVRKLSALAIVVLYVSALSTAALAGPPTMNLSSWEPVVEDGAIVGGTQTVTVTNITSQTMEDVTFSLVDTPCECNVTQSAASTGQVQDDVWLIGELAPDTTATLTLSYATPPSGGAAGTPGNNIPISRGAGLVAVGLFMTAVVVGYRRRLTSAIA